MTVRLSVTQCKVDCGDNLGKLVLRLTDPTLAANPECRYLPINVESVCDHACSGRSTYVINYDENLLADPGTFLTSTDFTLQCLDANYEAALEQLTKSLGALEDWVVDEPNVTQDVDPVAGTFIVTVPIVDRITSTLISTLTLDLSALFDDTVVTYTLAAGPGASEITLTGSDSSTNTIDLCPIVRTCFSGGDNVTIAADGTISAQMQVSTDAGNIAGIGSDGGIFVTATPMCVSTDAGNVALIGTDGCIYVPAPAAAPVDSVTAGDGLVNSGTAADPVLDVNPGCRIELISDEVRFAGEQDENTILKGNGTDNCMEALEVLPCNVVGRNGTNALGNIRFTGYAGSVPLTTGIIMPLGSMVNGSNAYFYNFPEVYENTSDCNQMVEMRAHLSTRVFRAAGVANGVVWNLLRVHSAGVGTLTGGAFAIGSSSNFNRNDDGGTHDAIRHEMQWSSQVQIRYLVPPGGTIQGRLRTDLTVQNASLPVFELANCGTSVVTAEYIIWRA